MIAIPLKRYFTAGLPGYGLQELLQRVVKPRGYGRRSGFHGDESAVGFVQGFRSLVVVPQRAEHFAQHLKIKVNQSVQRLFF